MAATVSILPGNSTELERALEVDRLRGLSDPIALTMSPEKIGIDRLPWLAWGMGVDFWDDEWPEDMKRRVVRNSVKHHSQKGTLAGAERAIRLNGAEMGKVVLPSERAFVSPGSSREERAAYFNRFPEIRVFRDRTRGQRVGAAPLGGIIGMVGKTYPGGGYENGNAFPVMSDALRRSLPRVFRVDADGTETELTTATFKRGTVQTETIRIERTPAQRGRVTVEDGGETVYEIVGKALRGKGAIFGDQDGTRFYLTGGSYMAEGRAHTRSFITTFRETLEQPEQGVELAREMVQPLLDRTRSGIGVSLTEGDAMTAQAERVVQPGQAFGFFPARGRAPRFIVDHYPGERMFLSSRIYDPSVPTPEQTGFFFLGVTRFAMPAFHAEITVKFRRRRSRFAFSSYILGNMVAQREALSPSLLQALRTTVSVRDKVSLNTKTFAPVTARGSTIAGPEVTAGKWRPIQ